MDSLKNVDWRGLYRSATSKVKQYALNLTPLEVKVEEATNSDTWGPHGSVMNGGCRRGVGRGDSRLGVAPRAGGGTAQLYAPTVHAPALTAIGLQRLLKLPLISRVTGRLWASSHGGCRRR